MLVIDPASRSMATSEIDCEESQCIARCVVLSLDSGYCHIMPWSVESTSATVLMQPFLSSIMLVHLCIFPALTPGAMLAVSSPSSPPFMSVFAIMARRTSHLHNHLEFSCVSDNTAHDLLLLTLILLLRIFHDREVYPPISQLPTLLLREMTDRALAVQKQQVLR